MLWFAIKSSSSSSIVETLHTDSMTVPLHLYILSFIFCWRTSLLFTQRLQDYLWNTADFYRPATSFFIRMWFALLNSAPLPGSLVPHVYSAAIRLDKAVSPLTLTAIYISENEFVACLWTWFESDVCSDTWEKFSKEKMVLFGWRLFFFFYGMIA